MALIATAHTTSRTHTIYTFLRTMGLTFARQPFLFIARITTAYAGSNALAMTAIEIANWFTLIGIFGIGFIAHIAPAGIWSCASAMQTGFIANGYTVIEEQGLVAGITGAYAGCRAITIFTTLGAIRLTHLFLVVRIHITLIAFAGVGSRTKAIYTILLTNGCTTVSIGFLITLMTLTFAWLTAETVFTVFGASGFTPNSGAITIGVTLETGTLIGSRTKGINTLIHTHRHTSLRTETPEIRITLLTGTHLRLFAHTIHAAT